MLCIAVAESHLVAFPFPARYYDARRRLRLDRHDEDIGEREYRRDRTEHVPEKGEPPVLVRDCRLMLKPSGQTRLADLSRYQNRQPDHA